MTTDAKVPHEGTIMTDVARMVTERRAELLRQREEFKRDILASRDAISSIDSQLAGLWRPPTKRKRQHVAKAAE